MTKACLKEGALQVMAKSRTERTEKEAELVQSAVAHLVECPPCTLRYQDFVLRGGWLDSSWLTAPVREPSVAQQAADRLFQWIDAMQGSGGGHIGLLYEPGLGHTAADIQRRLMRVAGKRRWRFQYCDIGSALDPLARIVLVPDSSLLSGLGIPGDGQVWITATPIRSGRRHEFDRRLALTQVSSFTTLREEFVERWQAFQSSLAGTARRVLRIVAAPGLAGVPLRESQIAAMLGENAEDLDDALLELQDSGILSNLSGKGNGNDLFCLTDIECAWSFVLPKEDRHAALIEWFATLDFQRSDDRQRAQALFSYLIEHGAGRLALGVLKDRLASEARLLAEFYCLSTAQDFLGWGILLDRLELKAGLEILNLGRARHPKNEALTHAAGESHARRAEESGEDATDVNFRAAEECFKGVSNRAIADHSMIRLYLAIGAEGGNMANNIYGSDRPMDKHWLSLRALIDARNRSAAAADYLRQLRELDPDGYHADLIEAEYFSLRGEPAAALRSLDKTLGRQLDCLPALTLKARILRERGELQQALQVLEHCLKLDEENKFALHLRADILGEQGDLSGYAGLFEVYPWNIAGLISRAHWMLMTSPPDLAAIRSLLDRVDGGNRYAQSLRGRLALAEGKIDEGLEILRALTPVGGDALRDQHILALARTHNFPAMKDRCNGSPRGAHSQNTWGRAFRLRALTETDADARLKDLQAALGYHRQALAEDAANLYTRRALAGCMKEIAPPSGGPKQGEVAEHLKAVREAGMAETEPLDLFG